MKITKTQLKQIINEEISSTLAEFGWKPQVTKRGPTKYRTSKRHSKPDHSTGHIGGGFGGTPLDGAKSDLADAAGIEVKDLPPSLQRIKDLRSFEKFTADLWKLADNRERYSKKSYKEIIRSLLPKK